MPGRAENSAQGGIFGQGMILWKGIKERRREIRVDVCVKARIRVVEAQTDTPVTSWCDANTINLSDKGFCLALASLSLEGFHLTRCLQSPEEYLIGVEMFPASKAPWQMTAEVKWIDRQMDEEDFSFRLGAALVKGLPQGWRRMLKD